jgi:DNA polymerase
MLDFHIDIETKSGQDLKKMGVYRYVADPDFDILLFGYSEDDGETVEVLDFTGQNPRYVKAELIDILQDPRIRKHAYNAQFERVCLSHYFDVYLDPGQWFCTQVHAYYAGMSGGNLEGIANMLGTTERKAAGTRLINKFTKPPFCRPEDDPTGWKEFIEYNRQDVYTEIEVAKKLINIPLPEYEQRLYVVDQIINDRGLLIDPVMAAEASKMVTEAGSRAKKQMQALTGLKNPNSVKQLKDWLDKKGYWMKSIDKKFLIPLLRKKNLDPIVKKVLTLRIEAGYSSIKKYFVARDAVTDDGRIRGCLQFYGALTGRWAGRLMQIQNLPDTTLPNLAEAREFVRNGAYDALETVYGSVPYALKNLVRTAIIAPQGKALFCVDFASIEARVLAWLAEEKWVLDVFRTHGKIYETTASKMYRVPIEKVTKDLRQRGKVAVLACGYGAGAAALAERINLPEKERKKIVDDWRKANPKIIKFWADIEQAAKTAIRTGKTVRVGRITIGMHATTILFIQLPSGRRLYYRNAFTRLNQIKYKNTKSTISTYGGKLVENCTQAVARDLLAEAILNLHAAGYEIIGSVHDEVIIEKNLGADPEMDLEEIIKITLKKPAWAASLPVNAGGFISPFYKK